MLEMEIVEEKSFVYENARKRVEGQTMRWEKAFSKHKFVMKIQFQCYNASNYWKGKKGRSAQEAKVCVRNTMREIYFRMVAKGITK
jgi:cbb3-type cytochrome oxidase subunit 3